MHNFVLPGFLLGGLAAAAIVQPAHAAEFRPYSDAAFAAAQAEGRPILIDVHASWCPVCARQQPLIERAAEDPANADLVVFRLDFDSQKAEQRRFRVTKQSTLIAFDGKRETARLLGSTDGEAIARLIASTRG
ncbi:MAG: thioredoxin family protein [Erythrobacter sp.]|uniref:thioredoxin family protein n=1 Tax=Erythrobacter sp. HL-111 TaxID=1798193 RepID=UPI0006D95983|nr:thioredoxin family protein [Erythrobacter sp. HL-111]KPP92920.1 MAG: putative thioredoxin [Erythrobacteraceae bacterium HL-111]SDT01835.1 Thiol-disulfide isomerase or thioredoxin [Erythrobacter sp. HL-111]